MTTLGRDLTLPEGQRLADAASPGPSGGDAWALTRHNEATEDAA